MSKYIGQGEELFYIEVVDENGRFVEEAEVWLSMVTESGQVTATEKMIGAKAYIPLSTVFDARRLSFHAYKPGYEYVTEEVDSGTPLVGRTFRLALRRSVYIRAGIPLLAMGAVLGLGTALFGKEK